MFASIGIIELLIMLVSLVVAIGVPAAIIIGLVLMLRKRDEKMLAQRAAEQSTTDPQALPPHQESTWTPGMTAPTTRVAQPQPRQDPAPRPGAEGADRADTAE